MIGQTIDVLHKVPAHQRGILADPKNLPHQALIGVGPGMHRVRIDVGDTQARVGNEI